MTTGLKVREYFVAPEALEGYERFMPDAGSLCVLLSPWRPFVRGEGLNLCAYYLAENALYHYAGERAKELSGLRVVNGVNIKRTLQKAGIAARGENDLTATKEFGSLFAAQLILCKQVLRSAKLAEPALCLHCGRCAKACPGKALPMEDPKRCVRWWMDGMAMPEFAMDSVRWLFGCETCQLVCPRNAHISPVTAPEELKELLSYERMIFLDGPDKRRLAELVGKNLLTKGRVQAQALILAFRQGWPQTEDAAKRLQNAPQPAVASAADYVLRHISPSKS